MHVEAIEPEDEVERCDECDDPLDEDEGEMIGGRVLCPVCADWCVNCDEACDNCECGDDYRPRRDEEE